jgi:hypothetical protein
LQRGVQDEFQLQTSARLTSMIPVDRCYTPLPPCHGNALAIAFSSCVSIGAAIVLRERFSKHASNTAAPLQHRIELGIR